MWRLEASIVYFLVSISTLFLREQVSSGDQHSMICKNGQPVCYRNLPVFGLPMQGLQVQVTVHSTFDEHWGSELMLALLASIS